MSRKSDHEQDSAMMNDDDAVHWGRDLRLANQVKNNTQATTHTIKLGRLHDNL